MTRIALSVMAAALPVAAQTQTRSFDTSGDSYITAVRADLRGDLVIAGIAHGGGIPLLNAFQNRFTSSGMKITRDGGRTWQMGQRPTSSSLSLVIDPRDANTVYALGSTGIYRSRDATETWQKVTSNVFGLFVIDPQNPSTIYAAGSDASLFLKTTDGGATWIPLRLPGTSRFGYINPIALTLDTFRPGTVYASTYDTLYRSSDGGHSWVSIALPNSGVYAIGKPIVVFDPKTPGLVYLRYGGTFPHVFWWRSRDDMATWTRLEYPNLEYLSVDPLHSGILYAIDDAGYAIKSEDAGDTWKQLHKVQGTGPLTLIPGSPPTLIYTLYISYDGGTTWTPSPLGLSPTIASASAAPGVAYFLTSPGSNAFVARLDSSGQVRFSTLLGGPGGASASAVATDEAGNTYLAGNTSADDFPTTPGAAQAALNPGYPGQGFLAKFDPGGMLLWSTYMPSEVRSIAVDSDGSVVVLSPQGIRRASQNGARIDAIPSSALNYNSYLTSVAIAPNGNMAVAGKTRYPNRAGSPSYLIWMDRFGNTLSRTTLGQSSVNGVEIDEGGDAVIAGATHSDIGGTPGAWQSAPLGGCPIGPDGTAAYVARISAAGEVVSSTLLGGQCGDSANTLALAARGDAVVVGTAGSPAFPVVNPLEAGPVLGGVKGFVARVSPDASTLRFSTFLSFNGTYWSFVAAPPSGPIVLVSANTSTLTFLSEPEPAPIVVTGVGNALHNNNAAVAAGEIAFASTIGLGAETTGTGVDLQRAPAAELNGVCVYFGDRQVDLMGIGLNRIYFRVPPDVTSSGSTDLHVEYNGVSSNPIRVQMVPADPGLLSADGSGRGQAAARNDDGALNTPDNPARAGSVIRLYFTGASTDQLQVRANGKLLNVLSASQVPGFFPGLSEVFVETDTPGDVPVSLSVPIRFLIGYYSQFPVSPPLIVSVR